MEATAPPDAAAGTSTSTTTTVAVRFKYRGKFKKIRVAPAAGYDAVLRQVALGWKIAGGAQQHQQPTIELEFTDPATDEVNVLSADDDLQEVFAEAYKWEVTLDETSNAKGDAYGAGAGDDNDSRPFHADTGAQPLNEDAALHDQEVPTNEHWKDLVLADWRCRADVERHPFFISYRQAYESHVAELLFWQMKDAIASERAFKNGGLFPPESKYDGLHPFLDVQCLSAGEQWELNFMSGLFHSGIFILLCSDKGMEKMKYADTVPDNVLLEWELALQMKEEKGCDILPVLLSQRSSVKFDGKLRSGSFEFSTFDPLEFPDQLHCHHRSPRRQTVRRTVAEILKLQGPKVDRQNDVDKIVTKAREVQSKRVMEQQTIAPAAEIYLSRQSIDELEGWLKPLSAEMDKERDRLTKDFLPGTRKWLLDQVLGFLSAGDDDDDGSPTQRIMWLRGVAGVGKSVMAAIVAGELQAQSLLGGQFFCKHDDERRSSARNLILTLAFGLAQFSVHYGNLLLSIKATFPEILGRPIQEMFEALVQVPLQKLSSSGKLRQSVVLVVDALDECGRQNQRREILQVFAELSKTLPAQVKLLVTGRPEADIKEALEMLPTKSIEPSDEDNHRDQIFFAKHFLAAHGLEPSLVDEGADALVKKSSGVFVWLVTACKYLESSDSITLSVIQDLPEGGKLDGSMDAMYTRTFERMFGATVLQTTLRYVLSTIVLVHEPLTATGIVSLLSEDDPVDVYRAIRMLEPVLVLDTTTKKLRIFHKSVKDYLVDMSRCKNPLFQIDVFKDHALIAKWCITALNRNLKFNMCNLALPGFHADVPNFEAKVKSDIPEHVRYSAKHFWEHACATIDSLQPIVELEQGEGPAALNEQPRLVGDEQRGFLSPDLTAQLCSLFLANAHHLLEALSLLQCVSLAVPATVALEQAVGEDVEVQTPSTGRFKMRGLLQDVRRAVQMFQIPLRESALQVYFSAVPLSPSESAFHRLMAERGPAGIRAAAAERGGLARWSGCVNVLEGHTSLVHAAAFSADGRRVVSGSWDRTVRVWEAATGEEVRRLVGHSGEVHGAAFSPDGRMIASGGERGEVFVWDAETGEKLRELVGHVGWTSAVAFSPDGARIASAGMDCTTRVWDVATGKQLFKFGGRGRAGQWNAAFYTTSVAFNPLGRFLAVGSRDKMIYIYDFEQGQEALRITSHLGYVNGVAYSPDGQRLVSGSYDTTVRTWSANTGQELAVCIGHESEVHSVAFCPDGGRVVSGSSDKSIRVWNADTGEQLQILQSHHTEIHSLAYSPDGRFIVSGGYDQLIRIWSASSGESPDERGGGHAKRVKCAAVSGDRRLVVSGSADKTVRVWDVATGREVHRLEGHRGAVTSVGISNVDGGGGQLVVSAADDRSVRVWSVATGLEVHKFTVRRDDAVAAAVSADGRWVAFGRRDGGRAVLVWDSVTGREFSRVLAERGTGGGGGDVGDGAGMEADEAAVGDDVEWIDVFADQGLVARGGSVGVPSAEAAAAAAVDAGWVALENALVPFWLPPELRGEIQIVDESRFFALGAGMALAIAMPAVAVDTAWFG